MKGWKNENINLIFIKLKLQTQGWGKHWSRGNHPLKLTSDPLLAKHVIW